MFIADADVHVNDTPGELVPYCDQPWRMSLEDLAKSSYPYLLVPGFAPNFKPDPPISGCRPTRSVDTAALMRSELTELGIDVGILLPDHMLLFNLFPRNPSHEEFPAL